MKAVWIIDGHHLALQDGRNVYHPDASDIYTLISNEGKSNLDIEYNHPNNDLPDIRFSKVGAQLILKLYSDNAGIRLQLYAVRREILYPVDIIDGTIIDQCVGDNVWFYITGNKENIQDVISKAGIISNGNITMRQYFSLAEQEFIANNEYIKSEVDLSNLSFESSKDACVPSTLKATLFPYQETGFKWIDKMLDECSGCILGDEMGLGKTMQVITEMLSLKDRVNNPMLVVAPISLLTNWQREIAKFAPSLRTKLHYGSMRISNYREFLVYDVIVTSYTTVVSDICMLNMINWSLVALDEAQNIKNPNSARTKACKQVSRERSIAVSGTPFENHVTDIWSLMDFVQPNLLGSLENYQEAISDDEEGGKKIEPILSPLMIRRMVTDVAKDLPEKVVITQPLQMSEYECLEYEKCLDEQKEKFNSDNIGLPMLQTLRIFCTHPFAATEKPNLLDDPSEASVKYQRFCEIVDEIVGKNEKVIVFTSYKRMFEIFKNDVPQRFGIQLWTINGETPVDERQKIVDRFNGLEGSAILILNPKAAGTGLNITGANHVIHYNLEWNPSLEDQSSARAYRRGQEKTVFIYRLYYVDTVEQVVNERIERKRSIASNAIVGNDGQSQDRADIIRALELLPSINKQNK